MQETAVLIADEIHPNEPCWGIAEGPLMLNMPNGKVQERWVQEVIVIRNDRKYHWRKDIGPASKYKDVVPYINPCLLEHSVEEAIWGAEKHRNDKYWHKRSLEMQAESTLMQDAAAQNDEIELARRNISTLGPYQKTQRNDYAPGLNAKKMKERREERTGRKVHYPNG